MASSQDKKDGADVQPSASKQEEPFTSITEGSITMKYPAAEESSVFYNPVQVQNRDLSILMLTLYSERCAVRKAVAAKRQELRQQNQGKEGSSERMSGSQRKEQLEAYEASLNPSLIAQEQGDLTILDALAASGLRSMRYWKEIPGVKHVTINDLELAAVERAHTNVEGNGLTEVLVQEEEKDHHNTLWQRPRGIQVQHGDAKMELYRSQRPQAMREKHNPQAHQLMAQLQPQWDVIDLDPYGSAAPFLDAAVQAIETGGMLCVTCTDMAALGGSHPETCYGRYASMPVPNARYLQESALRILLGSLATTASKYGRTIQPILSVGMNFYIRVFVEVKDDKAGVSKLSLQIGSVFQSTQCPSFHTVAHGRLGGKKGNGYQPQRAPQVPQCEETGAEFKVGGPMWLGPLHDPAVVQTALDRLTATTTDDDENHTYPRMKWIATQQRLEGLLTSVKEELPDAPLYYGLPDMCKTLKCSAPPLMDVKAALLNAGYKVSGYHKDPQAIKTNAPNQLLWDILRAWCETQKEPKKPPPEGSAAAKILATKPCFEVDFTHPKELREQQYRGDKKKKVSRFPMNPEKNWGPKKAAAGHKKRKLDDREEGKDAS